MRRVYMDSNATTPVLPEVFEALTPFYTEQFGNASSIHQFGQKARGAVEHAREAVATMLGCRAAEVVFTSGGTESDNLALFGMLQPGDHVITSTIEHSAVRRTCKVMEDRGIEVTVVPVDSHCVIDPELVRAAIKPNTKLISIMMANNETGVVQDVEAIGRIAKEATEKYDKKIYFHTDAVQAAGKVKIDVNKIGCDLLSISGHKMHAPQGTGALYIKSGVPIKPLLIGGTHERHRRAGTENLPGIVGLGKAAEIVTRGFEDGSVGKIAAMRDRLQAGILKSVDECGINGAGAPRVPNSLNVHFDHIEGEALIIALDLKGVAISSGAACSSGSIEPSPVLLAMGMPHAQARSSVRISLGKHNTDADVDFALSIIPETVAKLRELSPVYKKKEAVTT
ncbi:MAG TPA: cysteine desulfurase family protein [Terriglobales bacterium]|nr:cysteine desulfurase family protein [Terriglobales bacterium]